MTGNRMRSLLCGLAALCMLGAGHPAWSDEAPEYQEGAEHLLTGQVVAVWCHLREGVFGTGKLNNSKQMNCIRLGSPIAIKVGKTFYLTSCHDSQVKRKLAGWAGYQVTVRGIVTEEAGQPTIAISHIERAKGKTESVSLAKTE